MPASRRIREGFQGQRLYVLAPPAQERCRALPVVRDLHATDVGHFPSAAGHYVQRPGGARETILIYSAQGSGWCRIAGCRWRIEEGSAVFIPARAPHAYGADAATPWAIYWVHFRGRAAEDHLRALGVSPSSPLLRVPETALISQAFEEILGYVPHGSGDAALLGMSTALSRLIGLLRWHQRAPGRRARHGEDKVLRSIEHIRSHMSEPCHPPALAKLVNLSGSHYCHLFKRFTGASPLLFARRLKMQEACRQLANSDAAVGEIANRLGYEDPLHFSRMFRRTVGLSPAQYRRHALDRAGRRPGRFM